MCCLIYALTVMCQIRAILDTPRSSASFAAVQRPSRAACVGGDPCFWQQRYWCSPADSTRH